MMKTGDGMAAGNPLKLPRPMWDVGPKYIFQKELGTGTYGSVCEAICVPTGTKVAIKRFPDLFKDKVMCKRVLREIEILYSLNHPFIVKPFEMFTRNNNAEVYLVMELGQSDMRRLSRAAVYLDEKQIQLLMYRLLVSLNYLHSGGIVHRDIKPGNILVNSDCSILLCDFSISRSTAGLHSGSFDCDFAIRQNPVLNASTSSFGSLASMSLQSFSATHLDDDEEENELAEGPVGQQKTVYCDFEVKFQKGANAKQPPPEEKRKSKLTLSMEEKAKVLEAKKKKQREVLLNKCKETIPGFERELTGHIGTRWYRSPEIVLLEKIYSTAVDLWAAGCVFAELLQMIIDNQPDYHNRTALFPGSSCFPLSPSAEPTSYIAGLPVSPRDQFNVILSVRGSPNEKEISFVNDKKAEEYIKGFGPYPKKDLGATFKVADPQALDLLERLLTFNPYFRITAKEALRHKYFEDIRDKSIESEFVHPIHLQTDKCPDEKIMAMAPELLQKISN